MIRVWNALRPRGARTPPVPGKGPFGSLRFQCNICGNPCALEMESLEREAGKCTSCDANLRARAVVDRLSWMLFGKGMTIQQFPSTAKAIVGIGMSDTGSYASRLTAKLAYRNTFYHREPRLDIEHPDPRDAHRFDFIISSDVMEHVAPPVLDAFINLRGLLRPGGALVLTVPFKMDGPTVEHFPELYEYRLERSNGEFTLRNRTRDGRLQTFNGLVFHGGPGSTLEMRVFSMSGLREVLEAAGFRDVAFHAQPSFEFGIYWKWPWGVPVTARAG